jgi:hypothetical protein
LQHPPLPKHRSLGLPFSLPRGLVNCAVPERVPSHGRGATSVSRAQTWSEADARPDPRPPSVPRANSMSAAAPSSHSGRCTPAIVQLWTPAHHPPYAALSPPRTLLSEFPDRPPLKLPEMGRSRPGPEPAGPYNTLRGARLSSELSPWHSHRVEFQQRPH